MEGTDPLAGSRGGGIASISFSPAVETRRLKIVLDSNKYPGYNEIDAVKLRTKPAALNGLLRRGQLLFRRPPTRPHLVLAVGPAHARGRRFSLARVGSFSLRFGSGAFLSGKTMFETLSERKQAPDPLAYHATVVGFFVALHVDTPNAAQSTRRFESMDVSADQQYRMVEKNEHG